MAGAPRNSGGASSASGPKRKVSPQSKDGSPNGPNGKGGNGNGKGNDFANGDGNAAPKRIKTARACDSCRRKKIRCDLPEDKTPTGSIDNGLNGVVCAHCTQYGFECTFFLPITETRFKRKKEREAEAAAAAEKAAQEQANQMMGGMGMGMGAPGMNMQGMQHYSGVGGPSSHPGMMGLPPIATGGPQMVQRPGPSYSHPTPIEAGPPGHISRTQEWPRKDPGHRWTTPWSAGGTPNAQHNIISTPASAALRASPEEAESSRSGASKTPSRIYSPMNSHVKSDRGSSHSSSSTPHPPDSRVLGPTSIAYIVHSTAFVPGAAIEAHDIKHHQTFEVGTSGDGIIKFHKPPKGGPSSCSGDDEDIPRIPDSIRSRLAGDVAEKLVNSYFEKIATLFPVVTKSEFLHLSPPPPLLLYSICAVAALSREVPKEVLGAVKMTLAALFRENDLMSVSSNVTIRSLLIMSLHSDLHGSTAVQSGTRMWNRTGTAIRMAQDLGLHRDASGRDDTDADAFFLEQKRRIWGCCVTADRCVSISMGHPLQIDLTDCDVRLPSPYEILRFPTDPPSDPHAERPFSFNTEMLKISILFGRVMKTIYSPTGLMKATDEEITGLLGDMDRWFDNLPTELRFSGPESSAPAGILYVMFASLQMLFFRVFMRISYVCPTHLSFSLTIERMTALIRYSRESIAWVDKNDFYLDTFQMVSYALVFCATTQYHAYVRRQDKAALESLKQCRDCLTRFRREGVEVQEELTLRAKTAEVISLLYEAASSASTAPLSTGHLNPTAGVTNRRTKETVSGLVFRADPTKPGGGVYVSTSRDLILKDLPKGTIILEETETGRVPALMRTSASDGRDGWQALDAQGVALPAGSGRTPPDDPLNVEGDPNLRRPSTEGLTHLGAGVFVDANGKPVSYRGSKLVTMVPLQPNEFPSLNQSLDMGSMNNGTDLGHSGERRFSLGLSNFNFASDPAINVNPHLNENAGWQAGYNLGYPTIGTPNSSSNPNNIAGNQQDALPLMLDNLPTALDFDHWDSFFQRFQDPNQAPQQQGGMISNGGMPDRQQQPTYQQQQQPQASSSYMPS